MKTRQGFVSNSSSSSFIIAYKGDKPTVSRLVDVLGVRPNALLYDFSIAIAEYLLTAEELDDYDKENMKIFPKSYGLQGHLFHEGFTILKGSCLDERWGIEAAMVDLELDYESDDLVIKKEAGY